MFSKLRNRLARRFRGAVTALEMVLERFGHPGFSSPARHSASRAF